MIKIALPLAMALALAATPALAKSKHKKHRAHHGYGYSAAPYAYGPGHRWNTRTVSDPSFGNRAGINEARASGRCVTDLGYGRYEYCGW